ncbi:MAG: S-methyl-5-thioribose-1-phosphate isomerase [bacterium]
MSDFETIEFKEGQLILIDQTKLPLNEEYIATDDYERIAVTIERLEVRGAPAIGVTAAYGLALSMKNAKGNSEEIFHKAYKRLAATRPTAVNLFWALDEIKNEFEINKSAENLFEILIHKARTIHQDDINKCDALAANGLKIFQKKSNVLTHCNAGKLATGGNGTAVYVITNAFKQGLVNKVFSDETRPLLQGSRLTAFELSKAGIPFEIIIDSSAAMVMKQGLVDLVITGADRIAANGDSANKIGTYGLAVLCKHHGIPFYIAAPDTTIDRACPSGSEIKIEERNKKEITHFRDVPITNPDYPVYSPAFDVTPIELITAIITDSGIYQPPYKF